MPGRARGDRGGRSAAPSRGGGRQGRGSRDEPQQKRGGGPARGVGRSSTAGRGMSASLGRAESLPSYSSSHHNQSSRGGRTPGSAGRKGGRTPVGQGSGSQQVNDFLCVQLERGGVWKVMVPPGQTFGKQFLAGLEAWALQMRQELSSRSGRNPKAAAGGDTRAPRTPPTGGIPMPHRTLDSSGLKVGSAPPQLSPVTQAATGPADFSFLSLLGTPPAKTQPATATSTQAAKRAAPAALEGNFYRPTVEREPAAAGDSPTSPDTAAQKGAGGDALHSEQSDSQASSPGVFAEGVGEGDSGEGEGDEAAAGAEAHHESEGEWSQGDEGEGEGDGEGEGEGYSYDDLSLRDVRGSTEGPDDEDVLSSDAYYEEEEGEDQFEFEIEPSRGASSGADYSGTAQAAVGGGSPQGTHCAAGLEDTQAGPRVRVSLRLERMELTDAHMEYFTRWYQERGYSLIEFIKLWLFDNRLSDGAAACVAGLVHSGMREIHLSHNVITTEGALQLLRSLSTDRSGAEGNPLWLRIEWNIINIETFMRALDTEKSSRGLIADIPQAVPAGEDHGHEMNLRLTSSPHGSRGAKAVAHVILPWVTCQKQAPREATVLQDMKDVYRSGARGAPSRPAAAAPTRAPISLTPKSDIAPRRSSGSGSGAAASAVNTTPPPPRPPARAPIALSPTQALDLTELITAGSEWQGGPLMLFPDTSALMSMIGANTDQQPKGLSLDFLVGLAREQRFGRHGLSPEDQVFLVLSDSVIKQLDGLKALPGVRAGVRAFLSQGLEECGPAGLNFLTVLGAHEGEGLALSAGVLGAAGSRSPYLQNKGQQVDYRIVEVALFFQQEVLKALSGSSGSKTSAQDTADSPTRTADPRRALPVLLLSNDNAQIAAARSHGLPAYRLSSETPEVTATLRGLAKDKGGTQLTACLLRGMMGPAATAGLGSPAPSVPLQECFDAAVAALHSATAALATASDVLWGVQGAVDGAEAGGMPAEDALSAVRSALAGGQGLGGGGEEGRSLLASLSGLANALQGPLAQWEERVKSHREPSRVLQWAVPHVWES